MASRAVGAYLRQRGFTMNQPMGGDESKRASRAIKRITSDPSVGGEGGFWRTRKTRSGKVVREWVRKRKPNL